MNIFDDLPDLALTPSDHESELDRYLATGVEEVKDALIWWYEKRRSFPCLSRMARDYLSIPGAYPLLSLHLIILMSNSI